MERERIILSLRPNFAEAIIAGKKRYELRRLRPAVPEGTVAYLYATSPIQAIVGDVTLGHAHSATPHELWSRFRNGLGLTKAEFDNYLEGADRAYAIELSGARRWRKPVSLSSVRQTISTFRPPQFYRRVSEGLADILAMARLAA